MTDMNQNIEDINMRQSLDIYDERPKAMTRYLQYYGWHFNKKMCDFAVGKMKKKGTKITPLNKEGLESILKQNGIVIENDILYDSVYVANMVKADFYGSSIEDEMHFARYIRDVLDDEDGYDGLVFNRWYADTVKKGIPIEWEEMI